MADMGFGLSRNDVMGVAYKIAESVEESIHSKMEVQAVRGSMVFVHDIRD